MTDMSVNILLTVVVGALFTTGVYLILERSLTRILVGILLISNGVNMLFLVASGPAGRSPLLGRNAPDEISDPLPQALVLTAIVITLGVSAFLLAMAYRSWQLNRHDDVQDDVEDALIRRRAERDEASASYDDSAGGTLDEEGSDTSDHGEDGVGKTGTLTGDSPNSLRKGI
ncbi:Na(+)/H(+) antiporter subunit C [Streptomyces sp. SS8]